MRKNNKTARSIPAGALYAAMRKGRTIAARLADHVDSVGRGFKHSRAEGFGRRPVQAIKFTVRRKLDQCPPEIRIPESIAVRYQGVMYSVPTDIVESGDIIENCASALWVDIDALRGNKGTPGFVVRGHGKFYLITAGHVVINKRNRNTSLDGDIILLDNQDIGGLKKSPSYFGVPGPTGLMLVDVGVVRLLNSALRTLFTRPPLSTLIGFAKRPDLKRQMRFKHYGFTTCPRGSIAAYYSTSFRAADSHLYFAPTMLEYHSDDGQNFEGGNSGGLIVDQTGKTLLGMHLLGKRRPDENGWGIAAYSIMRYLERKMDMDLELVTASDVL